MAQPAQVTSVEAIEGFRANLIVFLAKARPTLEEVANGVLRTRLWLQNDQRHFWENEIRQRRKKLERAQQELFSATLSQLQQATSSQLLAVRRAQEAVHDAEAKLALLKRWDRELENRSDPLMKLVDQLHNYLTTEMPRAVAYLDQTVKTLEAYAEIGAPGQLPRPAESGAAAEIPAQSPSAKLPVESAPGSGESGDATP